MKRLIIFCGALAMASAFVIPAHATNGMRMIGLGPVQDSMGGVGVGVTLDAASVLTNPAGMADLGARIDFGASYFKPTVQYKATETSGLGPFTGAIVNNNGATLDSDRGASPVPAFGLVVPINDKFRFGIGAYGVAGMGVDYPKNLYSNVTYTSYSQMRFAPGLYKINDIITVGAVLNVMYATMEYDAGNPANSPSFPQQPHMGASAFGYGATFGVKVKPIDMVTIGAAYETTSRFQHFDFNTAAGSESLRFNQPQSATIGLGFTPIAGLVLGLDVQWIRWSETNGENQPKYASMQPNTLPFNLNWNDQFVYKFGVQYQLPWNLVVRAGYNYGKMPLDSSRAFENIAFPAIAEHHITAGIGYTVMEHLTINIGGMYSPQATLKGSNSGFPPAAQGIASYETKMSQYSLDAGVSYVF